MSGSHPASSNAIGADEEWLGRRHHLEEYACEAAEMAFFMFCVVGIVTALFAPGSSVTVPASLRMFLAGLLAGLAFLAVAVSPPGRLSGAHVNPVVSLAFWLVGKMQFRDMVGYVVGQAAGAVAGVGIGQAVLGSPAREIRDAALRPGPGVSPATAFWSEAAVTFILLTLVLTFVSNKALVHWTAPMVTALICALVSLDGSVSGCGFNPARWLGSALVAGAWELSWVYTLGPLLGMLLTVAARRRLAGRLPLTGKLFHDYRYRSLFDIPRRA